MPLLYRIQEYEYKNKPKITYWTKECKTAQYKNIAQKTNNLEQMKIMKTPPKSDTEKKEKFQNSKNLQIKINIRIIIVNLKT